MDAAPSLVPVLGDIISLLEYIDGSPVTLKQIATITRRDPILSNVYQLLQKGWAGAYKEETLKPYYSRWNELNTDSGVVLWVSRVDVVLRDVILRQLHEGNPGVTRMKEVARSYV